jgi:hypothetical protein
MPNHRGLRGRAALNQRVGHSRRQPLALARLMLKAQRMTNTEFIVREKNVSHRPLLKPEDIHFGAVDFALVLAFLAAFVALVFLLSK